MEGAVAVRLRDACRRTPYGIRLCLTLPHVAPDRAGYGAAADVLSMGSCGREWAELVFAEFEVVITLVTADTDVAMIRTCDRWDRG